MIGRLGLMIAASLFVTASPASAKEWVVDYRQSHLRFTGTQGTAMFTGAFEKFQASIDFDPTKPENGKITAIVDLASATTGNAERDSALPGIDWFDTSKFPQAQFATTSIKPDASCAAPRPPGITDVQCYTADATLALKGIAKPVVLSFYITKGTPTHALGVVHLVRTDFGVGSGQWADETYVKHAVDVTIDIVATPAP